MEAVRVPEAGIPIRLLAVSGAVARSRGAQAAAALQLLPALVQAVAFLMRRHAAAVLAVGGYASVPGALAAGTLGLPVVLQEQNASPGVANRLLAPWSVAVACGFAEAVAAFPSLPARWTGNPVRAEFFAVPAPRTAPVSVVVMGGSQGSAFLNAGAPGRVRRARPELRAAAHRAPGGAALGGRGARALRPMRRRGRGDGVPGAPSRGVGRGRPRDRPRRGAHDRRARRGAAGGVAGSVRGRGPRSPARQRPRLRRDRRRRGAAGGRGDHSQSSPPRWPRCSRRRNASSSAGGPPARLARPDAAAAVARLVLERAGGEGGHP